MKYIFALIVFFAALDVSAADIYVSPKGDDGGDGTMAKPLKTLRMALRHARNLRRLNDASVKGGVTIHVMKGVYELYEPLYIRPEDSGTKESPTIIKCPLPTSPRGGEAIISGGVKVTGWKKEGKLLVAETPMFNGNLIDFRQLYINGKKATRARDVANFNDMSHILSLDKKNQIIYVPATKAVRALSKTIHQTPSPNTQHPEMVLHQMWCIANLRIKDIKIQGDSAAVTFFNPESTIQFEKPWPSPMVNTKPFTREDGKVLNLNSAFYLTGSKALLDEPGEWYHDTYNHKIYYYPRNGETIKDAIAPAMESLVQIEGTLDRPVHDLHIEGITFEYTTWMRPSTDGHVPLQAGMYLLEGYKLRPQTRRPDRNNGLDNQGFLGRPSSAVVVKNANDITFDNCTFKNLASSGIDYEEGTHGGYVSNSLFTEIGGSAIVAGSFSPSAFETHLPYDPYDRRVTVDGLVIANNTIHDVTTEDWGTLGICCGYVANTIVANNEIYDVSYSGINLGWGWTQSVNCMRGNEVYRNNIHHYAKHMYDCAGIYTLSSQIKTYIAENVVDNIYHPIYAHDPNHWFYLYCDEGSSGITVQNNWCPAEKFLKNANGPCNTWEKNGPMVNDSVKANAGVKKDLDVTTLRAIIQTKKPKVTK